MWIKENKLLIRDRGGITAIKLTSIRDIHCSCRINLQAQVLYKFLREGIPIYYHGENE